MNAEEIIRKKRNGDELSQKEIDWFIKGMASGKVADYQIGAWAMAVYFKGMTPEETSNLALAMANSGEIVDLSSISGIKVDKHSTGGVGDKTTPVVVPIVAAAGVPVPKMSGRGLGFTGGTVDKFESIPGFKSEMKRKDFLSQVTRIKAAVLSQSENLVPADKKLYAIRDLTATVDSIPLIASSVMSKKIASGADAILLDVKVGKGAFMKDLPQAIELAERMVDIGRSAGRKVVAVLTSMEQPLGYAIGNALEIREAVRTLKGQGPEDLEEICLLLAAHMLVLGGASHDVGRGLKKARQILESGQGYDKFCELVAAQGGQVNTLEHIIQVQAATLQVVVKSPETGFITSVDTEEVGRLAMMLGAGRESADDRIDPAVGMCLYKKPGDTVEKNEPLAMIHANDPYKLEIVRDRLLNSFEIGEEKPEPSKLVLGIVSEEGTQLM
ncbi:MAG: thymidine phosphorylase [Acidobacteriota bacterium]